MKKILLCLSISISFLILTNKSAYSINEPYASIADGNWSSASIWHYYNGVVWVPAVTPPTSAAGTIIVFHKVIVDYNVEVDQLTNNDTIIIGTGVTMTLVDGPGDDLINGKTILGPGTLRTQGFEVTLGLYGSGFKANFLVFIGNARAYDVPYYYPSFYGNVTITSGTTLFINSDEVLSVYNNFLNNGTVNGRFIFYGSSFINNGSILSSDFRIGGNNYDQNISGSGIFLSSLVYFSSGTIFQSDINCSNCTIASIIGSCNLNNYKLIINKGTIYYKFDVVPGSGTVETSDTVNIAVSNGSNIYDFSLHVLNGYTYIGTATIRKPITIESGAIMSFYNTSVEDNLTNYGTIIPQTIYFRGNALYNYGNILSDIYFYGNNLFNDGVMKGPNMELGTHTIQGSGLLTAFLVIRNGSITTLASNHKINNLYVNSGGTFDISNRFLSVSGSLTNEGTFLTGNSTIEYNGTTSQGITTTNVNYKNIIINNPAGVSLGGNLTLNDTLSIVNGDFNIGGNILTLSPTAILIETPGNTVFSSSGYVQTTQTLNALSSFNPCNIGVILTTASNLGSTIIRRGNTVQNNLNGTQSILRYYDITPTNNTGLNATLKFKYDDSELNGKPEGSLQLFRSTNNGSTWTFRGGTINTTTNEITLSGIDAFSRWSAGSGYLTSLIKVIPQGLYHSTTNRMNRKDTVRAYLRNVSSPFAIVDSAKSIIDSVTFNGSFIFTNAPTGIYYIQTKHRNSLETWSKSGGEAYNLGSVFSYDFTTASSQAFGNNMMLADASPVRYGIYTGDVNQDGSIDLTDVIQIYNDANNFVTGYVVTDLNRDNIADLTDVLMAYNNSVNFVGVVRP